MRAGILGRLSVKARDGRELLETSTDRQLRDCFDWVKREHGEVTRTYHEEGVSGWAKIERKEFDRLLTDLRDGTIDTIVVWKLDRLCRNHRDFQRLWDACERTGARLVSINETFDTSTPMGEWVARMLVGLAKMESDNISLRTRRALQAAREAGLLSKGGARPFGHTWKGERVPREAAVIRWAALRVLASQDGRVLGTICDELADRGIVGTRGRPIGRRQLKRMLTSGRVAGKVEHQRVIVGDGTWTPILQHATWTRVRAVLLRPDRAPTDRRAIRHLLVGWLYCGICGAKLVSRPIGRQSRPSYICIGGPKGQRLHLTVAVGPVEELISERVLDRTDHEGLGAVLARLDTSNGAAELAAERVRLDQAMLELSDDYYQHRVISKPEFLRQRAALQRRVGEIDAKLTRHAQRARLEGIPTEPGALRAWWASPAATIERKRAVLRLVLDPNVGIVVHKHQPGQARRTLDPARIEIPPDAWRA